MPEEGRLLTLTVVDNLKLITGEIRYRLAPAIHGHHIQADESRLVLRSQERQSQHLRDCESAEHFSYQNKPPARDSTYRKDWKTGLPWL